MCSLKQWISAFVILRSTIVKVNIQWINKKKLELSIHKKVTYMMVNRKIFVNSDLLHCASLQKYNTVQKFGVSIIFLKKVSYAY